MSESKYAQAVISMQISVPYKGRDCTILVRDPEKITEGVEGLTWPGGIYFPSTDIFDAAEKTLKRESGVKIVPGTMRLTNIVYSETKSISRRWIGNRTIRARAEPVDSWDEPEDPDFGVELYDTASLIRNTPERVKTIFGRKNSNDFKWAINDGSYIASLMARNLSGIPVSRPLTDEETKISGMDFGLDVVSLIIPHTYKGKRGYVAIRNSDNPDALALAGGKVERLEDIASHNIDVISCGVAEGEEEIGVNLRALSIVGVSMTPKDLLDLPPDVIEKIKGNSIFNTCILAQASNPHQMDEAIKDPMRRLGTEERKKIKDIRFVPEDEWDEIINRPMRTPDMAPLARLERRQNPDSRPNLERVSVLPIKPNEPFDYACSLTD